MLGWTLILDIFLVLTKGLKRSSRKIRERFRSVLQSTLRRRKKEEIKWWLNWGWVLMSWVSIRLRDLDWQQHSSLVWSQARECDILGASIASYPRLFFLFAREHKSDPPARSYQRLETISSSISYSISSLIIHSFTLLFIHGLISYLPSSFSSFIIAFTLIIGFLILRIN